MCNQGLLYHPEQYVSRALAEESFYDWLNTDTKRVFSIVGSSGVGKSWLLQHLGAQERQYRICLRFHAKELLDDRCRESVLTQILSQCDDNKNFIPDRDLSLEACIRAVITFICNCRDFPAPLIFVDGYEEVSLDEENQIAQRALRPMIDAQNSCARIVIARRKKLNVDLLRNEDRRVELSVFGTRELLPDDLEPDMMHNVGNSHLEKLHQQFPNVLSDTKNLANIQSYRWDHPFINQFLFCRLDEKTRHGLANPDVDKNDIQGCCLALINRPISSTFNMARFVEINLTHLRKLASTEHLWTLADAKKIGVSDEDLREYFHRKIIELHNPPFCKVTDGLRGLLQDLDRLIREEKE